MPFYTPEVKRIKILLGDPNVRVRLQRPGRYRMPPANLQYSRQERIYIDRNGDLFGLALALRFREVLPGLAYVSENTLSVTLNRNDVWEFFRNRDEKR